MTRRKQEPVDLVSARNQIEQVKALVISMGLPYTNVRRLDDALKVLDNLENRKKKNDKV